MWEEPTSDLAFVVTAADWPAVFLAHASMATSSYAFLEDRLTQVQGVEMFAWGRLGSHRSWRNTSRDGASSSSWITWTR